MQSAVGSTESVYIPNAHVARELAVKVNSIEACIEGLFHAWKHTPCNAGSLTCWHDIAFAAMSIFAYHIVQ